MSIHLVRTVFVIGTSTSSSSSSRSSSSSSSSLSSVSSSSSSRSSSSRSSSSSSSSSLSLSSSSSSSSSESSSSSSSLSESSSSSSSESQPSRKANFNYGVPTNYANLYHSDPEGYGVNSQFHTFKLYNRASSTPDSIEVYNGYDFSTMVDEHDLEELDDSNYIYIVRGSKRWMSYDPGGTNPRYNMAKPYDYDSEVPLTLPALNDPGLKAIFVSNDEYATLNTTTGRVTIYDFRNDSVSDCFTLSGIHQDIGFDGTNLLSVSFNSGLTPSNSEIFKYSGISNSISDSILCPLPIDTFVVDNTVDYIFWNADDTLMVTGRLERTSTDYNFLMELNGFNTTVNHCYITTSGSFGNRCKWTDKGARKVAANYSHAQTWDGWKNRIAETDATITTKNFLIMAYGTQIAFHDTSSFTIGHLYNMFDVLETPYTQLGTGLYALSYYNGDIFSLTSSNLQVWQWNNIDPNESKKVVIFASTKTGMAVDGSGNLCCSEFEKVFKYTGISSTINDSFSTQASVYCREITFIGADIVTAIDIGVSIDFKRRSGFSSTISNSFNITQASLGDFTWDGSDLWCQYYTYTAYPGFSYMLCQMNGFSATISNCWGLAHANSYGITYAASVKTGTIAGTSVVSPVQMCSPLQSVFHFDYDVWETGNSFKTQKFIRGSKTVFTQFATSPSWESIQDNGIIRDWQYIQLRFDSSSSISSSSRSSSESSSSSSNSSSSSSVSSSSSSSTSVASTQVMYIESNTSDGDTNITDSSEWGRTITKNGDPKHSTTTSAIGASSIRLDGNDNLEIAHSTELLILGKDIWLDLYVRFDSVSVLQYIISKWDDDDTNKREWRLRLSDAALLIFNGKNNAETFTLTSSTSLSINTWYRIRVVRIGDYFDLYIGSVLEDSYYTTLNILAADTPLKIGALHGSVGGDGSYMTGYIDEINFNIDDTFASSSSSSSG